MYLESPKTLFYAFVFWVKYLLRLCSKNAFSEMRTQKRYRVNLHPDASGADAERRLLDAKRRVLDAEKRSQDTVYGGSDRAQTKKEHFVTYAKNSAFFQTHLFLGKAKLKGSLARLKVDYNSLQHRSKQLAPQSDQEC